MRIRVGDVAVTPLPGGGFGACQISGMTDEAVTVHALDWFSAEPPALADLHDAGPVALDYYSYGDRIAQIAVFRQNHPVPPEFDWIGNLPVPAGVPSTVNAYSGWSAPAGDLVRQREWERLPAEVRAAYKQSRGTEPVIVDLGAGPVALKTDLGSLDLRLDTIPVPPDGPVDWSLLDQLPRCTQITWYGPDRGLVAALADRPLISSLNWFDAPPLVDLSKTSVRRLRVTGPLCREILLQPRAHALALGPTDGQCTVSAADDGRWLDLDLFGVTSTTPAPLGLSRAGSVSLLGPGAFSATTLAGFGAAHSLRLHWTRPPGRLDDPALLRDLSSVCLIEMVDAYGLAADTLPDLPQLRYLSIHGLRGSVARGLRARFRNTGVTLELRGAKSDTWLAANLDNPFRDWADDSTRAGAAACKAYATALRAIDKLPTPHVPAEAEPILHNLVTALNTIDGKHTIIDTLRREEAAEAFMALATRASVPTPTADSWFDNWRDF